MCFLLILVIYCTKLDRETIEKQTALLLKEAASLEVEAKTKQAEYFEILTKVYTPESVKKEMDKNNKAKGWY